MPPINRPPDAEKPRYTGAQKAAILCMSLGAEQAAKVTQRLSNEEVEAISFEIARMERVEPADAEQVLLEWIETSVGSEAFSSGGVDYCREILEKAFGPQKAQAILKRVLSMLNNNAGLQRLRTADPVQIANTFRNEHPQTIALILAHLAPPQTAMVFNELDPTLSTDVAYRMCKMEKVSPEMLTLIERSLGNDIDLDFQAGALSGGPAALAAVLNLVKSGVMKSILEKIEEKDSELSTQIKNLLFVFEDMIGLQDFAMQRILKDVDTKTLALALKGASEELKERIMARMSQRAITSVKDEMEMLGPVRMKEVEAAQSAIVAQARELEDAGEIALTGTQADDLVIA